MAEQPTRKLAVLLHADVVGSTALVRSNETLAHQRIQDAFRRFSVTIANQGGTAHEVRGDALVAEFSMASDAVAAALNFQTANTDHNQELPDEIRPAFRVGIAMGEVVVADNTVTVRISGPVLPGGLTLTAMDHLGLVPRGALGGLTHTPIDRQPCLSPDLSAAREHLAERLASPLHVTREGPDVLSRYCPVQAIRSWPSRLHRNQAWEVTRERTITASKAGCRRRRYPQGSARRRCRRRARSGSWQPVLRCNAARVPTDAAMDAIVW